MDYIRDYETVEKRLRLLLQGQLLDRCCVSVTAPKDPLHPYVDERTGDEAWYMDAECILRRNLQRFEKTYFAGDALPCVFPYFGTGGHAKYFGEDIPVKYDKDTIWIDPYLDSCADLRPADLEHSTFFRRECDIMRYLVDESRGRFFVSMPDNCGSYDALAQLRGSEELLMDMYDEPEAVEQAGDLVVDCLRRSSEVMFDIIRDAKGGTTHSWMNLYSTGRILQLQCDLSVMLSPSMYEQFICRELRGTLDFLDNAVYHIDGQEQIRHLDLLLGLDGIDMFQWVPVAGQPPLTAFFPELKKLQAAGKGLVLQVSKAQIAPVLENLSPAGVMLLVGDAASPEEADDIVRYVEKLSK